MGNEMKSRQEDALRLRKLLQTCTDAKVKFDKGNKIRSITMTFKASVGTGVQFQEELRKIIDDLHPSYIDGGEGLWSRGVSEVRSITT